MLRRHQSGLGVYAVTLIVTFLWTLYEVGFDKWQWIPRGALLVAFGLILCIPVFAREIRARSGRSGPGSPLPGGTVAVIVVLALVSWFIDPAQIKGALTKQANIGDGLVDPSGVAYPAEDWTAYGGTNLGQRYSALRDIGTGNVKGLTLAWEHHTGDLRKADEDSREYTFEATPIKVNGLLYFCTPHNIIQALVPETGAVKWSFDPMMKRDPFYQHQTCRGVSWNESTGYTAPASDTPEEQAAIAAAVAEFPKRIVASSVDARLYTVNADTGALCTTFGENGYVNLLDGMTETERASYQQTSAPLVTKDLIILGSAIAEPPSAMPLPTRSALRARPNRRPLSMRWPRWI